MSKHTPGPWRVQPAQITPTSKATTFEVVTDEWDVVAGRVGIRKETDATLIASAPDLLEALEDLINQCGKEQGELYWWIDLEQARAAIAKAKGESNEID